MAFVFRFMNLLSISLFLTMLEREVYMFSLGGIEIVKDFGIVGCYFHHFVVSLLNIKYFLYVDYFVDFLAEVYRFVWVFRTTAGWTFLCFPLLSLLNNRLLFLNNLNIILRLSKLTLRSLMRPWNHLRNLRSRLRNRSTLNTLLLKIHRILINTLFNTIEFNIWVTRTCFNLIHSSTYYCFVVLSFMFVMEGVGFICCFFSYCYRNILFGG